MLKDLVEDLLGRGGEYLGVGCDLGEGVGDFVFENGKEGSGELWMRFKRLGRGVGGKDGLVEKVLGEIGGVGEVDGGERQEQLGG
ncbi:hypothetical protein, partial [Neisseria sicca]|uniref:hypothetical protein n=1 Tax=Neisseria sicca TaxID=490 RepID=UPI001C99E8E9